MTALAEKTVEIAAQETAAREALAAAEQEAKTELSKLAAQEALGEVTPAQARRKRAAVEKRLAARRGVPLSNGHTQAELARFYGMSKMQIARRMAALRRAIVQQLEEP